MGIEFRWDNDTYTVMRYTASGDWNWKDYHLAVRHSILNLRRGMEPIDSVVDVRGGNALPHGLPAHVRTFGKRFHESLSGRAIAIGFPAEVVAELTEGKGWLTTQNDGILKFVDTDEEAQAILNEWRVEQGA